MSAKKTDAIDFGQQFKKLESITEWFEQEEIDLEQALKKFEEGLALVALLKKKLNEVENTVVELKKQFN